jgi:hypothetical protein
MRATVSARLVRPLLENEALAAIYADEARRLGVTLADLQAPDARVDYQSVVGLVAMAEQKTGSTSIGLHGAMFFGTGVYHVLDYLVRTSANVLEALKRVGRYYRLFTTPSSSPSSAARTPTSFSSG